MFQPANLEGGVCLEARVSSGLASSTLQSASAQPFLYRPTRGSPSPLPPLTPHPVTGGGWRVSPSHCQSLSPLLSWPGCTAECGRVYRNVRAKGQSTVGWFWLWPPNPPSCSDLLCLCPEVSRNGQTMWLKSRQQPKLLRTSWEEPKIMPKSLKNGMVYLKFKTSMIVVERCNVWKKVTLTLCQKEKECIISDRSARLNWKTGCKGGLVCYSEFALV